MVTGPISDNFPSTSHIFWTVSLCASICFALVEKPASNRDQRKNHRRPAQVTEWTKETILKDPSSRVSEEFDVPNNLMKRVGFWFDVYSKYTAQEHVIHHADFPWIVFSVVSTESVPDDPNNRWAKFHNSAKLVRLERRRIKRLLWNLSKKSNFTRMTKEETKIFTSLSEIPGKRSKVLRAASEEIRVQLGQKDFMLSGLDVSKSYLPHFEAIFDQRKLPLELTRLPLVESSFNVAAVSKVGASGVWQIMPTTGRKFLTIDTDFDERNSPIKSTEAAAILMAQNFRILKSWPLALTAYNHGPGGLITAQKRVGTNDIGKIIERYSSHRFGFASSNFYCSFLAALHIEKYQTELFKLPNATNEKKFAEVELTHSLRTKPLLKLLGMTSEEFLSYNLDIRETAIVRNKKFPKGFRIHIPEGVQEKLESYLKNLPQSISQKDNQKKSLL